MTKTWQGLSRLASDDVPSCCVTFVNRSAERGHCSSSVTVDRQCWFSTNTDSIKRGCCWSRCDCLTPPQSPSCNVCHDIKPSNTRQQREMRQDLQTTTMVFNSALGHLTNIEPKGSLGSRAGPHAIPPYDPHNRLVFSARCWMSPGCSSFFSFSLFSLSL